MAYKIYTSGNYFIIENTATNDYIEEIKSNVLVKKSKTTSTTYDILFRNNLELTVAFANIQDENGDAYASASAFETFYKDNTGFNPAVGGSTATTTTVNISSAQILAMGSTPIELLPAAGVGKYYDIEKIILEYTHVTTAYTLADDYLYTVIPLSAVSNQLITSGSSGYAVMSPINNGASNLEPYTFTYPVVNSLNTAMTFTTWASTDPTLGDGTLRAVITYTIRTFGA